jgi:hypothetical protein
MKVFLELTLGLLTISCVDAFAVPPRTLWAVSLFQIYAILGQEMDHYLPESLRCTCILTLLLD